MAGPMIDPYLPAGRRDHTSAPVELLTACSRIPSTPEGSLGVRKAFAPTIVGTLSESKVKSSLPLRASTTQLERRFACSHSFDPDRTEVVAERPPAQPKSLCHICLPLSVRADQV